MLSSILEPLARFSLNLISTLGYTGIVVVMILENLFPPIPSEVLMPFAGFLVSQGRFNLTLTIAMGVLGSILGAIILYYMGYVLGEEKVKKFIIRWGKFAFISATDLQNGEDWFNKHGEKSVFFARVVPIVRSIISVPAGFIKMSMIKFLVLTTIGTSVWTTFLTCLGVILGENWSVVGPIFKKFDYIVILIIFAAIAFFVHKKKKVRSDLLRGRTSAS